MSACCHATPSETSPPDNSREWLLIGIAGVIAAQSMAFGLAANLSPPEGAERLALHAALAAAAVIVFLLVGLPIVREAWSGVVRGRIVVEQLFLAGIIGAFAASIQASLSGRGSIYYEVVAVLAAIYTLGRVLGQRRRQSATAAARRLRSEFSRARRVTCCGAMDQVDVDLVQPGDRVRVLSGEGVPVDGRITEGTSFVRETALNGETFPVVKRAGDEVLAGSIIEDGVLTILATRPGNQRRLDLLLGALSDATSRKAVIEREADRIVAWFLPLVMLLSAAAFAGWTAARGWETGLFHAMAVLLVACPCAMGLATPIGIWNALNDLAREGVVLKSGEAIEALGTVDTVVFDKTGTLSEESYAVVDAVTAPGFDRDKVRRQLSALQTCSAHPVAQAFASWAGPAPDGIAGDFCTLPGLGISGAVQGVRIEAGNTGLVRNDAAAALLDQLRETLPPAGGSHEFVVFVDGSLAMLAQLRERMRVSADTALARLEQLGAEVWIMTGDPAWAPSRLPGVPAPRTLTGLSPEEKAARVSALAVKGRRVLFVGDGVNDAPAMAAAHASLALASGADLSRTTASGELFGGDIARVPETIELCRRTLRAIKTNLTFAAAYNFAGISLALAGLLHPVAAALLMLGSSLTVTARALGQSGRRAPRLEGMNAAGIHGAVETPA